MVQKDLLNDIRNELRQLADPEVKKSGERFFKEEVQLYGIKTPAVRKIAKKYLADIKKWKKKDVFNACDALWQSGYLEEASIACDWSYALHKGYAPGDVAVFERWVKKYVTNWAVCDTLCNHTIGTVVDMYPQHISRLKKWATSKNRWMRRAAAVTLIIPARQGKFLSDIFAIADILLLDQDDMVQKGYGWMLKAASEAHQQEVFAYVMQHKDVMPRTALRYAIEKMPPELKKRAMVR